MTRRYSLPEAWAWLVIFLLAFGYLFKADGLLVLGGVMAPVLLLAWWWNRAALENLIYDRRVRFWRAFPDERVDCEISIENHAWLPVPWLRISDRWPRPVGPEDGSPLGPAHSEAEGLLDMVLALRGRARLRRRYPLRFRRRGIYAVGPVRLTAGDPFGFFRSEVVRRRMQRLVVFPRLRPLRELGLRADDPFGVRPTARRLYEDTSQPIGVRDYQPEDGFRRIHWPATARTGHLQSRVYQPVSGMDVVICLNVTTLEQHWLGVQPELLEALTSTAATLVYEAFQRGHRVGLISNGTVAHGGRAFRIAPGRSRQQLPRLLEALAGLTPIVTAPFERFLLRQAPHLEYGSLLVVVTAITPPELLEALMRLRARTRRTTLISLAEAPPGHIPGVQTVHLPLGAEVPA